MFSKALKLYRKGEWNKAIKSFEKIGDKTSMMFLERCKVLQKNKIKDWDGVFTMKTK